MAPAGAVIKSDYRESGGSECLDLCGQTALGARSLILVDDLFVGNAIQNSHGLLENTLSSSFVAGVDCLADTFDCGTQGGTQAGVVGALLVSLTCALACLCAVGHEYIQ